MLYFVLRLLLFILIFIFIIAQMDVIFGVQQNGIMLCKIESAGNATIYSWLIILQSPVSHLETIKDPFL